MQKRQGFIGFVYVFFEGSIGKFIIDLLMLHSGVHQSTKIPGYMIFYITFSQHIVSYASSHHFN